MKKEFQSNGCSEIKLESTIQNNFGFEQLYTEVYLGLNNGKKTSKAIFSTPEDLTDGSIPLTPAFQHHEGTLYLRHYLTYEAMPGGLDQAKTAAKKLQFHYTITNNCDAKTSNFKGFGLGPTFIESGSLVFFVTLIDIV
ncbi:MULTISPECIES: hypothetical protein [Flavobacterium]|uniref:Uncharacterized protein n=1 Tax=Flavobacterium lipolyticum TaxID=2893754 RepID=A0ABS8M5H0_9FLAO|nr:MULTISPECIES: hypothetical protein [unclassified Flavobacterium]MCC9020056.1 hypothetical protein [Flavobacterium sp. F-126]